MIVLLINHLTLILKNPGVPTSQYKSLEELFLSGKDMRNFCMNCFVDQVEDYLFIEDNSNSKLIIIKDKIQNDIKHCYTCNKCVINFDHHCIWVNNCIGIKTYNYFTSYLSLIVINSLYKIAFLISFILRVREESKINMIKEKDTINTGNNVSEILSLNIIKYIQNYFILVILIITFCASM